MKKLKICVIDMVSKAPTKAMWARLMNANFASFMPQAIAVWCEEFGHEVSLVCYTGFEDLVDEVPSDTDIVFIGAFTQAAQASYALSNRFRSQGAITVLGGPHARCYPQDAQKYFDYVLGFTDQSLVQDVLQDCAQHRPLGQHLCAKTQPKSLPSARQRWKFIEQTLEKAPFIKIIPMIGSMGCPYTCSFCIDSTVTYQPLDFEEIHDDLKFLLTKFKRPRVGWHDPNFGIRFNDYLDTIERAVPPDSIDFIAESSLSILTEPHLKRLKTNGFKAILPGIESWYDMGNKSKTGKKQGEDKLHQVSEHVNMILSYLPYVQTNFVLGLDMDESSEPFELTKQFVDNASAAFPAYSLLSAFGQAAPLNLEYQRDDRVLPFPFHFLNNNHAMNVKPKNYSWPEFYDHVIDLTAHSYSKSSIAKRFKASTNNTTRWLNLTRAISSEGFGRLRFYREVRRLLEEDKPFRDYFERETTEVPAFYMDMMKRDLGELWDWLPDGAIQHDPNAYLKSEMAKEALAS